jgi:hypothetical protein
MTEVNRALNMNSDSLLVGCAEAQTMKPRCDHTLKDVIRRDTDFCFGVVPDIPNISGFEDELQALPTRQQSRQQSRQQLCSKNDPSPNFLTLFNAS